MTRTKKKQNPGQAGSQFHLQRLLFSGMHKTSLRQFEQTILKVLDLPGVEIEWKRPPNKSGEFGGIGFLKGSHLWEQSLKKFWNRFWVPGRGKRQTWDAIGWVKTAAGDEHWILIEAKSTLSELKGKGCEAKVGTPNRRRITDSLRRVRNEYSSGNKRSWCGPYYQYANRLATHYFLREQEVNSHLVFVYLLGDNTKRTQKWPECEQDWKEAIGGCKEALGLKEAPHGVHEIFFRVPTLKEHQGAT